MSIKKAILCAIIGLLGHVTAIATPKSGLAAGKWGGTVPTFRPMPVSWSALNRDSASFDFTAFLTLPDSLGDLPVELWLDSSQTLNPALVIRRLNHLDSDEAVFLAALRAILKMDWLDAGVKHRAAMNSKPASRFHSALTANFGLLLVAVGESREGEGKLSEAAKMGEAGSYARRSLVNLLLAMNRWDEAEKWMDEALLNRWDVSFHIKAKAFLLRQDGSDSAYEAFLAQQVTIGPGNMGLRKTYGALLLKQGRYREAAQMFQKAVEVNPRDGDAWVALGRAFKEQGLWIFAEESFRHALRVGTHDLDVFSLYAQVIWQFFVGRDRSHGESALKDAQSLLEKGLALQLHQSSTARLLFDVYGWLGNRKAANALRQNLWFHFEGPERDIVLNLGSLQFEEEKKFQLRLSLSSTTFPIYRYLAYHAHWPRNLDGPAMP